MNIEKIINNAEEIIKSIDDYYECSTNSSYKDGWLIDMSRRESLNDLISCLKKS